MKDYNVATMDHAKSGAQRGLIQKLRVNSLNTKAGRRVFGVGLSSSTAANARISTAEISSGTKFFSKVSAGS